MATNNITLIVANLLPKKVKLNIAQVLIMIFLCINMLLIITFFKKDCFRSTLRYILFAVTLLSDSLILFLTDILLFLVYFNITIPVWLCMIFSLPILLCITVTPVTLTAMTLERYVAVCMPLRHGDLCSSHRTLHCILIIHSLSSIPCVIIFSSFFASASISFYKQYYMCSVEIFDIWQSYLRPALYQVQFLIMCIVIVFAYVKMLKVARAASGENKTLSDKGLRTVVLHGFQLLLCLIQLWCPFIEAAIISSIFYENVRYSNYILFYVAPKCLSPLIYGLRDECFFKTLKTFVYLGLLKRNLT